jgi:hypothetical protein
VSESVVIVEPVTLAGAAAEDGLGICARFAEALLQSS